jgi:hypothetical protein
MTHRKTHLEAEFAAKRLDCESDDGDLCDVMNCACGRELGAAILARHISSCIPETTGLFITLYDRGYKFPARSLCKFDIDKFVRLIKRRIKMAGLTNFVAIGAVDIQFLYVLEDGDGLWQPHVHLYCTTGDSQTVVRKKLRQHFVPGPLSLKPVDVRPISRWPVNTSYLLKREMVLRFLQNGRMLHPKMRLSGSYRFEMRYLMQRSPLKQWLVYIGGRFYK